MFEVGFTEIILIFGIALLVLGPARLPKLAADVGRWAGRARAMARQLRTQLEQETQFDPLADPKPAPPAPSNTIHSPAPNTAPNTSPNTSSYTSGDESRAAPAQLASATPPAEMISDKANQSVSAEWEAADGIVCPECGAKLIKKVKQKRVLLTRDGRKIELALDYGVCVACGAGIFPPG